MVKKLILSIGVVSILSGCTLIGVMMDQAAFDGDIEFFQDAGKEIDKKILAKKKKEPIPKRDLEKACIHAKIEFEECLEQQKKL